MNFELVQPAHHALPIKERIQWFIDRAAEGGWDISRKKAKELMNEEKECLMYQNAEYVVLHYAGKHADHVVHVDELKGQCDYLSIRTQSRVAGRNWEDFQDIKNHFCGREREAMELYPRESRMVNAANQYHLIVMPENFTIPFGF